MGYTHYWAFKPIKSGDADKVDRLFKKVVKECAKIIKDWNAHCPEHARLSGYTAHTPIGRYGGIELNGKGEYAHEDFIIREHYKDNIKGEFCKTVCKPYDTVVVACLCILKHRLKDYIDVNSDGDAIDWNLGVSLARSVLKLKTIKIPNTISIPVPRLAKKA